MFYSTDTFVSPFGIPFDLDVYIFLMSLCNVITDHVPSLKFLITDNGITTLMVQTVEENLNKVPVVLST